MRRLDVEYIRNDKRGSLIQVNTGEWKQLNHLIIKKGNEFGGHYHKHKEEFFYVLDGKILISIKGKNCLIREVKKRGECFIIEPFEVHTIKAIKNSVLIELLSEPYSQADTIDE